MLVARPDGALPDGQTHPSRIPVLLSVGRRLVPQVVEATLAPALIFTVALHTLGAGTAMIAALCWSYGAVARRLVLHKPIPGILMLANIGLLIRTGVALLAGSTFMYFVQPVATTVVLAGVFLGSLFMERPIIARLAGDFCPLAPEIASRPRVVRLFSGLTVLWAGVHLLTATTTFVMLVSLPVGTFVPVKTLACFGITATAVVLTVAWSVRIARTEQLVFARVS